jgi:hypothetical protein
MAPRPFVAALAALLTFSLALLLFRHQQVSAPASFSYPGFFGSGPSGRSLGAWVVDEETRYDFVLQDRQQLISKWTTAFDSCVLPLPLIRARVCACIIFCSL